MSDALPSAHIQHHVLYPGALLPLLLLSSACRSPCLPSTPTSTPTPAIRLLFNRKLQKRLDTKTWLSGNTLLLYLGVFFNGRWSCACGHTCRYPYLSLSLLQRLGHSLLVPDGQHQTGVNQGRVNVFLQKSALSAHPPGLQRLHCHSVRGVPSGSRCLLPNCRSTCLILIPSDTEVGDGRKDPGHNFYC